MPEVRSLKEQEQLNSYFQETVYKKVEGRLVPYSGWCDKFFLPYSDSVKEGLWRDDRTGLALQYSQWGGGQPNGQETQNYVLVYQAWGRGAQWGDDAGRGGRAGRCVICTSDRVPVLRLRGLCPHTKLSNNVFTPVNTGWRGNLGYRGLGNTNIEYNETSYLWVLQRVGDPGRWTYATTTATKATGLLGTHKWTVYNDSRECSQSPSYTSLLTLTSCSAKEFTCKDGACVSMAGRCNGKVDCSDSSDEISCTMAVVTESYSQAMTPPPAVRDGKTDVVIDVRIKAIRHVDEIGEIFYIKYHIITSWIDRRLTYHNLKEEADFNILSDEEKLKIWIPKVIFENTEKTESTLLDQSTIIRIIPDVNHTYTKTNLNHRQNIYLFEGAKTTVEMSRTYQTEFICLYEMAWYPFDSQSCTLDFVLPVTTSSFVQLESGRLDYLGPTELTQYFVRQTTMRKYRDGPEEQGVRVFVVLGRRLLGNILTVYGPTVLLNVMGHITVYFKPFYFEAIITVNLTVMLVLTTM